MGSNFNGKKLLLFVLFSIGLFAFTRTAEASGDLGCSTRWKLANPGFNGCSNTAILSPGNDTRVNLLLLMADLHGLHSAPRSSKSTVLGKDSPIFGWDDAVELLGDLNKVEVEDSNGVDSLTTDNCPIDPSSLKDPFSQVVRADKSLSQQERNALLAARGAVQVICSPNKSDPIVAQAQTQVKSDAAKAYFTYLKGARAFQEAQYDDAVQIFSSLTSSRTPWVQETATYMIARTLLNHAQVGAFDEYGTSDKRWHADSALIQKTEAALDNYLSAYPNGIYATSARGLKRRVYWITGDVARLIAEYSALLRVPAEKRGFDDISLIQEIDNKLLAIQYYAGFDTNLYILDNLIQNSKDPLMLAVLDLMAMRASTDYEESPTNSGGRTADSYKHALRLTKLKEQQPFFRNQLSLYEYLLAVHQFYIEKNPAEVLHLIPDSARQASFSYVQFSRQGLRGMALEALHDRNALGFWRQMLPGAKAPFQHSALELAIASNYERAGSLNAVFNADSPVHFPYLREALLTYVAGPDLLRQQAKNSTVPERERNIALFTLLFKEATLSKAADFLQDLAMVPADAPTGGDFGLTDYYGNTTKIPLGMFNDKKPLNTALGCGSLRETEARLAKSQDDPTAQLCIGDFALEKAYVVSVLSMAPPVDEVGGTKTLFPGGTFVRMDIYKDVLANPKSSDKDKAYALYRAVNCYAPSGSNDCGGNDVPIAQRKTWFRSLKRDYPNTTWAQELRYYW